MDPVEPCRLRFREMYPDTTGVPVKAVASFLGSGESTVYAKLAGGELRGFHVGRSVRIIPESVDEFIDRNALAVA